MSETRIYPQDQYSGELLVEQSRYGDGAYDGAYVQARQRKAVVDLWLTRDETLQLIEALQATLRDDR